MIDLKLLTVRKLGDTHYIKLGAKNAQVGDQFYLLPVDYGFKLVKKEVFDAEPDRFVSVKDLL